MSASLKEVNDLCVCKLCSGTFKIPKCLPCLHTFCKVCLESSIKSEFDKAVLSEDASISGFCCPICRTFTPMSFASKGEIESKIEKLPTNNLMVNLIDRKGITNNKKICVSCNRQGTEKIATFWCCNCSDLLCDICAEFHKSSTASLTHEILKLEQVQNIPQSKFVPKENCEVHSEKKLEVFCHDHIQPCCITCITVEHRHCEHITSLEEAATEMRTNVSEISDSLRTLNEEFRAEIANCVRSRKNLESLKTKMQTKIKRLKDKAMKHIENLENKLQQEISLQEKEADEELCENEERLQDQQAILLQCLKNLNLAVNYATDVQLFLEINKIDSKVAEMKEFLATAIEDSKTFKMNFEAHDALPNLMQAKVFGSLSLSSDRPHKKLVKPTSVPQLQDVITKSRARFTHIAFIDDDYIIACDDRGNDVSLYRLSGELATSLKVPGGPWGICLLSPSMAVITIHSPDQLMFINTDVNTKTLSQHRTLPLDERPYGVTCSEGNIIVSHVKKICVMQPDGSVIHTINTDDRYIYDVQIFKDNMILYSDYEHDYVYCIMLDGTVVFEYSHEQLQWPVGIASDSEGNIFLAGYEQHTIQQLTEDGQLVRELLAKSDGLMKPFSIRVRSIGDIFYMAISCQHTIRIYTLK